MGFLSGIFSRKGNSQNIYRDEEAAEEPLNESLDEGLTGVAKYLNAQTDRPSVQSTSSKHLSAVDKYISSRNSSKTELSSAEKEEINARITETIEKRKIEESLMSAENEELSGVAKYVEKQEQAYKEAKEQEEAVTGVAKYISNIVENKPATTGVAKYLKNRAEVKVSSVDRYVINKALADKNKPAAEAPLPPSGVAKYLANKPTLMTSSVAKYIAKQSVAARQAVA
ncbi:MAG: hypothetical protein GQ583_07935 [Methyloprofundus sp.]|nr:hypothetical protein [Methyloprofundus sp.]